VDKVVRQSVAGWSTDRAQELYASVDREERKLAAGAVVELVMGAGK
jgi:hypothetical protein